MFVICLPTEHLGVLKNSLNVSVRSISNCNLEVLVFKERGKPEYPEKNLSEQGSKIPPTNSRLKKKKKGRKYQQRTQDNPHIASALGFEPRLHWLEASALAAAPPLLPERRGKLA